MDLIQSFIIFETSLFIDTTFLVEEYTSVCCLQVPAMALAFLDSPEDAPKLEGGGKLRLSVYPGPLKYPLMAAYVNAAAEALG